MLIVGVGGQGVILVSKVLAWLAQQRGYQVKQSEVHGMAKRGGSVFSHVRYGREVWSPTIARGEVDLLVALEWAEALRWLPWLKPGSGMLVCDTRRIVPPFSCLNRRPGAALRYSRETPAEVQEHVAEGHAIDATAIAEELGNERASNVVLLGAVSTALEFTDEEWEAGLAEFVPPKTLVVNVAALRRGREWIDRARRGEETARAPVAAADGGDRHRGAARDHARVVQELRHLRQALPGALPAPRRRPHRRTRRSRQVHRLPAVRVAVPRLRDPGAPRAAPGSAAGEALAPPRERARERAEVGAVRGATAPPRLLSGNHAAALGALAAGCRFFAGYPITPSSEVAERMARLLPPVGGVFVQMEDEIASMAAVIGASMGGVKAMTATSGPGFSLKQENLGYAAGRGDSVRDRRRDARRPVDRHADASRAGRPDAVALGQPRRLSGHRAHARVGARGPRRDGARVRAVRVPAHAGRRAVRPGDRAADRDRRPAGAPAPSAPSSGTGRRARPRDFQPYAAGDDQVPPMARPGAGYRTHTTGLTHAENGFPTQAPAVVERNQTRLLTKLQKNRARIESFEAEHSEDAEVLVVAIGISARAAKRAVAAARARGIAAGLFRPITLWPFPEDALRAAAARARAVLVPELNAGQLVLEVERVLRGHRVVGLNRYDGEPIAPAQIEARIGQLAREAAMMFDTAADFDVRQYLRPERMPHHLCPGCGHGIALRALLWAIDDEGIDKDRLAVVSGIGCAGRLSGEHRREHLSRHARPAARVRHRPCTGAARPARDRDHRRRRLPRDRRQSPDPRVPPQPEADVPDAEQRDLRHDRRAGLAHHVREHADHHDSARQRGARVRCVRAGGRGGRGVRRPRGHASRAEAEGTRAPGAASIRASPSSRCCPTAPRSSAARTSWARRRRW